MAAKELKYPSNLNICILGTEESMKTLFTKYLKLGEEEVQKSTENPICKSEMVNTETGEAIPVNFSITAVGCLCSASKRLNPLDAIKDMKINCVVIVRENQDICRDDALRSRDHFLNCCRHISYDVIYEVFLDCVKIQQFHHFERFSFPFSHEENLLFILGLACFIRLEEHHEFANMLLVHFGKEGEKI